MRLSRKFDRILALVFVMVATLLFLCLLRTNSKMTFAEGEEASVAVREAKFVTFYDEGKKLTVKTEAATVDEALERAGITVNAGDKVEPALETAIDANNFFINIYRARPVVIRDGLIEKYLMTANYDARIMAREAGFLVYDGDRIDLVVNKNFLETGVAEVYQITRNGGQTVTVEEEIPFDEETIKDYNMKPGTSEVRQLGEVGTKKMVYEVFYIDGAEISKKLISDEVTREPVTRIVAVGASPIEKRPLTAATGRNRYTVTLTDGKVIERQETYYDLPMAGVMHYCGGGDYTIREDGAKVDSDGYVLVAADLSRYPRCSVVETSLGLGKVYDTGEFVLSNPEQFDLATDWTNKNGR